MAVNYYDQIEPPCVEAVCLAMPVIDGVRVCMQLLGRGSYFQEYHDCPLFDTGLDGSSPVGLLLY